MHAFKQLLGRPHQQHIGGHGVCADTYGRLQPLLPRPQITGMHVFKQLLAGPHQQHSGGHVVRAYKDDRLWRQRPRLQRAAHARQLCLHWRWLLQRLACLRTSTRDA